MSQNLSVRAANPAEQAKLLMGQAAPQQTADPSISYNVSLGVNDGDFVLNWTVTPKVYGRWDWVGVFKSPEDAQSNPDGNYMFGGWQWAEDGSPYQTRISVNSGYVVAYVVWNYGADEYQAVAISNPY
ncbi:hypothetical protein [Cohnella zeiphila]|uniref:Uncharacterized protein n=1 Tax=Cohnella zeiphila TaxID=2761120 RepID=A0A7X0SKI6_9BACL|nr:hypothetical protein [Cohnella zeiphila]MBB6731683.1 hypothetical protein [Cohnella zeiphila]